MQTFPDYIIPTRKDEFQQLRLDAITRQMRQDIHDLILKGNESDFFDLEIFNRRHLNDISKTREICSVLIGELEALGWRTKMGYGDTGLFIYSTEDPPANAW